MFDADIVPVSRSRLQFVPELNLAWLNAAQKTDVSAFTLVNEPDDKVSNELFAGVRWQLE